MPSSEKFRDHVLQQFKGELRVTTRKMMGEYILYADGKIFGGIYDDRFLVKLTDSSRRLMPSAPLELPYEGAKEMLRVDDEISGVFLKELLNATFDELTTPKKKQ